MFFDWLVQSLVGGGRWGEVIALGWSTFSVLMEQWMVQHHVLAYDTFTWNDESVFATQRTLHHFSIGWNDKVPSHNTILHWVKALRTTGNIVKKPLSNPVPAVRMLENVTTVRETTNRSLSWSTHQHGPSLQMSCESVKKNCMFEVQSYKMMVVQQLGERDSNNEKTLLYICMWYLKIIQMQ